MGHPVKKWPGHPSKLKSWSRAPIQIKELTRAPIRFTKLARAPIQVKELTPRTHEPQQPLPVTIACESSVMTPGFSLSSFSPTKHNALPAPGVAQ